MSGQALKKDDPMVMKLVLDMKAVGLLHPSESELRSALETSILDSKDEQVRRVVNSMGVGKTNGRTGSVVVAVGELILASLLMISGLLAISALFSGSASSNYIVQFFSSSVNDVVTTSPMQQALPVLELAFSILLLLSALYTLRRASATLKKAGLQPSR
ncbi:MAG: hypothetical protein ABSB26_04420 [Nitrososphaerales archaeon]